MKGYCLILLFFLCSLLCAPCAKAQYVLTGSPPFSEKWKQIKTKDFQLVFPERYEEEARLFARKLDYARLKIASSLRHEVSKISIVMHNQPAFSNGMAAWAPKRIELYTTPHQNMYAQKWLDQLLIHELRHFVQMDKLDVGFTKVLGVLFGEQGLAMSLGASIPPWFLEGDAVVAETLLTDVGRGRMPTFHQGIRAFFLEQERPQYSQAILGSYQTNMPNHYEWGYQMVLANRLLEKENIFESQLDRLARCPLAKVPYSFRRRKNSYYERAFNYLEPLWQEQDSLLETSKYTVESVASSLFTSYINLQADGVHIFAEKSSLSSIPEFVQWNGEQEECVTRRGARAGGRLSAGGGKLVWEEYTPDKRYELRSYSDIMIMDRETKQQRRLTSQSLMFAPAIDQAGEKLVAVQVDLQSQAYLKILDAEDGSELGAIRAETGVYYQHPFWIDKHTIGVIEHSNEGQSLVEIRWDSGVRKLLLFAGNQYIAKPVFVGDYIYFSGSWSGIDNIYALNRFDLQVFQLTSARFGASYPAVAGERLWYADYSAQGYRLVSVPLKDALWLALDKVTSVALNLQDSIVRQEGVDVLDWSMLEEDDFEVRKYSRANLFNFHSWGLGLGYDQEGLFPGLAVMSQNLLGTATLVAGYNHARDKKYERWFADFSYKGWWPILNVGMRYGVQEVSFLNGHGDGVDRRVSLAAADVDVFTLDFSTSLPINLSRGMWVRGIRATAAFDLVWRGRFNYQEASFDVPSGEVLWQTKQGDLVDNALMKYALEYFNFQQKAPRHLQTPWGQNLRLVYAKDVGEVSRSSLWGGQGDFYFPGLDITHSLRITLAYEHRNNDLLGDINGPRYEFQLDPLLSMPKGYSFLHGNDYVLASFNYSLPIAYPDWQLGSVLYLKRLALSAFYDWSYLSLSKSDNAEERVHPSSYGGDFTGEFYFFNYEAPIGLGFRYGKKLLDESYFSEVLMSISF